ncbi:uncharacterized protein DC041_0010254 [Schistosoma bovis]|uniref:Uncharacterized protein n=1 Tax=Schistosoma bovis TaxID=6184 RepID=A0A430QHS1_SCHBO|nr:uncharacterized protein DC041_0010254 [Schistosoma bovis]
MQHARLFWHLWYVFQHIPCVFCVWNMVQIM